VAWTARVRFSVDALRFFKASIRKPSISFVKSIRPSAYNSIQLRETAQIWLGKPRCKRDNNIKVGLTGIWCESMDYFHMAQDKTHWRALVNATMGCPASIKGGKCPYYLSNCQS
jgi:hypothetical protein